MPIRAPCSASTSTRAGIHQRLLRRREVSQQVRGAGEPVAAEDLFDAAEVERDVLDVRAELGEAPRRALDDRGDLRIDGGVSEVRRVADAPAAHAFVEPVAIVTAVVRQREPVARVGPRDHGQQQRGVADRAGHRPQMRDGAERRDRPRRHAPERRLQAEQAGEGARNPDRSAAVGADRQRTHAGGDRRGAAARRSARRLRRVPRVARDAGQRAVGHALPAELRRRVLAEQHRPALAQPRHRRRIVSPRTCRIDRLRAAQRRPALREQQILDRHRHAVEQAVRRAPHPRRFGLLCHRQRIGRDVAERVEQWIERLDSLQDRAGHLDGRGAPGAVEIDQFGGGARQQVCRHRRRGSD